MLEGEGGEGSGVVEIQLTGEISPIIPVEGSLRIFKLENRLPEELRSLDAVVILDEIP